MIPELNDPKMWEAQNVHLLSTPKHHYAYECLMTKNEKAISETNVDLLELIMTHVLILRPF